MSQDTRSSLEYFGRFLSENLRDKVMEHFDLMSKGHWKAPELMPLQDKVVNLSEEQKEILRRALLSSLDSGIHDFLFKLNEQADFDNRICVTVDGNNIVEESDGIHGEIFSENGWFAKYSKDGEPQGGD